MMEIITDYVKSLDRPFQWAMGIVLALIYEGLKWI